MDGHIEGLGIGPVRRPLNVIWIHHELCGVEMCMEARRPGGGASEAKLNGARAGRCVGDGAAGGFEDVVDGPVCEGVAGGGEGGVVAGEQVASTQLCPGNGPGWEAEA